MDYFYKGTAIKKNAPVSWIAKADTLAANTDLVCVQNVDNKKNSVLSATAYFSAFTSLTVAHGYQLNYGNWCVVDETNVTTYYGTGATQMSQVAHGLTISDFLTITIKQKTTQNAEITVMTAGGQFTTATVPHWHGSNGDVRMFGAQAMTDAEVSYGLSDTRHDVFLFVDSYGTEGDSARVSRQIQNLGYDGFLALGHGGGNSAQTYPQFAKLIELAQPKVAVWMIGMNDPDSSSAINASWKSYAEQFAAACEARGIVPVFTTIPNVPNYQHTYKNAWIKESGYRYVDWAKAVGAEEAGSSWYTGMLSSDNVHPSELGAKALAMRTILDVPEITPKVEGGGAVTSVNGKTGAVTLSASDVHALPDSTVIPAAVTEQTVAGWGFTKNTGTYSKPSGGIPASDLAQAVQDKLDESGLPGVTESDIGKVLAVDSNGEWAAENPVIVSGTDAQVTDAVNDWLDENGLLVATIIDGDTLFVDNMAVIANYDEEEF